MTESSIDVFYVCFCVGKGGKRSIQKFKPPVLNDTKIENQKVFEENIFAKVKRILQACNIEHYHNKMKNCIPLIVLAWLSRFLLVGADSPPRRIRTRTKIVAKKASSIPLPSHPFGEADFRNAYRMNSRKYWNKGKHHERQLQNKKTHTRNDKARKGSSQKKFDWKRGRGGSGKDNKGKKQKKYTFRKFVAW